MMGMNFTASEVREILDFALYRCRPLAKDNEVNELAADILAKSGLTADEIMAMVVTAKLSQE